MKNTSVMRFSWGLGFLAKDSSPAELALAIEVVSRGDFYLSPKITNIVMQGYAECADQTYFQQAVQRYRPLLPLTPRPREILQLVVEGCSTKDIAAFLQISTKTVEAHCLQLMKRLDIHDIAGLVRYAILYRMTAVD